MSRPALALLPEDWTRLLAYAVGVLWGTALTLIVPTFYVGIVSLVFVHIWSGLMGVGFLIALVGLITRRDLKVELPGLYLALTGMTLYLVAQAGFLFTSEWHDRAAATVGLSFITLMLTVRVVQLETIRRRTHAAARLLGRDER